MVLSIFFKGWFQCRLATDPDHYRHPRGSQGWTFAVQGEPDLDRIIRFREPVAPRSHAAAVAVLVSAVEKDGVAVPGHPLLGAPVELLDDALFEGRNGIIAPSAQEPIVPWHLRIRAGDIVVEGRDAMDLSDDVEVARRQPIGLDQVSTEALAASGVGDPVVFRQQRLQAVNADLLATQDPVQRAALTARKQQLGLSGIQQASLAFKLDYSYEMRGPNALSDPNDRLGFNGAAPTQWSTSFWMGAWDADALSGFIQGRIELAP